MDREAVVQVLVKFFLDEFSSDASGVGDWLTQSGQDVDAFYAAVQAMREKS